MTPSFRASWLSLALLWGACTATIDINQSGQPSDPGSELPPPVTCGDGVVNSETGEQCDDGNQNDGDSCKNNCTLPACGDGVTSGAEECDDANNVNNDDCKNDCSLPACGDGVLSFGEQCDDGNTANNDGCNAACDLEQNDAALIILTPAESDAFEREEFNDSFEFVTTPLTFTALANDPNIVSVEYVTENDFSLGIGSAPDFLVEEPFRIDGNRTITAHGRNSAGVEIATAVVHFVINPPVDESCLARLTQAGVTFNQAPPTLGIHTPVRFFSPLAGITYLPFGASAPRSDGELAACSLVETLVNTGNVLTSKGINKVEHLGIYNFRCIGGGDPRTDNCNPSQHAFATGIDLHEFRNAAGQTFNVETDFVIDADGNTCSAATSNTKDALLHEIACAIHNSTTLFHIVLTPNFNSDHRNHFHVDITSGSNFIRSFVPVDPQTTLPLGD